MAMQYPYVYLSPYVGNNYRLLAHSPTNGTRREKIRILTIITAVDNNISMRVSNIKSGQNVTQNIKIQTTF